MEYESYKKRLIHFNKSDKYFIEMKFLSLLLSPEAGDKILDYGCGTGTALKYLRNECDAVVHGFDIFNYTDGLKNIYIDKVSGIYNKIYFFHSLAHIRNPGSILKELRRCLKDNSYIYILTPNLDFDMYFIKNHPSEDYKPDETVVRHFSMKS